MESSSILWISVALCLALLTLLILTGFWWFPSRQSGKLVDSGVALDHRSRDTKHSRWLAQLRWAAAGGILLLIFAGVPVFHFLPQTALPHLLVWWLVLVAGNFIFSRRIGRRENPEKEMACHLALDLVVLTGLLNASGGVENPFYFSYVFPVIVGATLLQERYALLLTLLACALFCVLGAGEAMGFLPHVTLELFPHDHDTAAAHASHDTRFVVGKSLSLVVLILLSSLLTTLLRRRLRESEEAISVAAHQAIQEHERLEGMIQAAGVGMIVVKPETRIDWFSERTGAWLGWDHEVQGRICPLHETQGGCHECVAERAFETGRPAESERQISSGSAGPHHFRHVAEPVHDEAGRVVQVVELVEDITRRKTLETQALHASKLSVLGKLSAGIAHEIGNPIASLMTRLQRMEKKPDERFVRESLPVLRHQIERIDRTIRNVSSFSRLPASRPGRQPINGIIESVLELFRLDPRVKKVRIECDLVEPSPVIEAVADHVSQVILNLLLNAVEALPDGGKVQVRSRVRGERVTVEVLDNGPGIEPGLVERIFEPFSSTKEKGVGLGLAISRSLILAHGGTIDVSSSRAGSSFTITLPLSTAGKPAAPKEGSRA